MKIYSFRGGWFVVVFMAFESLLCLTIGLITLPHVSSLYYFITSVIFAILSVLFIFFKYLNYIEVNEQGIKHKNITYTWDEVFITADYNVSFMEARGRSFTYQLLFSDRYLLEKNDRLLCRKNGFFIYLHKKRLSIILSYYKKSIEIIKKSPSYISLFNMMKEHNKTFEE